VSTLLDRVAALGPEGRAALMSRLREAPRRPDVATGEPVPASPAQTRLWLHQQLDPGSPLYNLTAGLRLLGRLDPGILQRTLAETLRRHEALRTAFPAVRGLPVQVVAPPGPAPLTRVDLRPLPRADREARLRELCREQGRRPFALDRAPLARFLLVRLDTEDHLLLPVVHHLVADGWSFTVFSREFAALYEAYSAGLGSPLPELPVQYRELTLAPSGPRAERAVAAQLEHWTAALAGIPPLHLPTDRERPAAQTVAGRLRAFEVPPELGAALRERAARTGRTPFAALLAGFAVLLHRLSGQDRFVVGTPVAGRGRVEAEGLIGFFVNTLPLPVDLSGFPSHAEAERRVDRSLVAALSNQDVPFDRVVQALRLPRDPSRPVLRQVAFALQTPPPPVTLPGGLSVRTVSPAEVDPGLSPLELSLHLWDGDAGGFAGVVEYRTDLFEPSTVDRWVAGLLAVLRESVEAPDAPVRPRPARAAVGRAESNLTGSQLLFWFGKRYQPDVRLYYEHITTLTVVRADLDAGHFRAAFSTLVRFSDSLRSVFTDDEGVPRRLVREDLTVEVDEVDLSGRPDPEAALTEWVERRRAGDFDLGERLYDTALLRLGPAHCVWYLNVHHLVSDAWSTALILRYVSRYYELSRQGRLADAVPPPPYADWVAHERRWRDSARYAKAERYWREKLAVDVPRLGFYERGDPRAPTRTCRMSVDLGPGRTRRIRELTRQEGFMSPAVVLGCALFAYLYRVSGERTLRVGTPFAGRPAAFRDTVGLFMNACPLQVTVDGHVDFRTLARAVQVEVAEAGRYQEYPVPHPPGRRLYDAYLNFQNASFAAFGGTVEVRLVGSEDSNDRLALQVQDFAGAGSLTVDFDFGVHAFGGGDRERTTTHYLALLDALLDDPGQPVSRPRMLPAAEAARVRAAGTGPRRPYPLDVPLHGWVRRQAGLTPQAEAVRYEGRSTTYRELDAAANRLARQLADLGTRRDAVVGVCMERCPELVVALLGILKAGAAYLPLDPALPADRLSFMADDAAVDVVLTRRGWDAAGTPTARHLLPVDPAGPAGYGDRDPGTLAAPDDLAYVLYTSGSTGRPKGVMIPHRGIVNRLLWMQETYRLDRPDRVLQKTPFGFDVSVWEFFWPLMTGACLVLARPGGHGDPAYLVEAIRHERITTLHFVPSMLGAFLEAPQVESCRSLRRIFSSGEALPAQLAERCLRRLSRAALHNLYGPTEASVDVSSWTCPPGGSLADVPIGHPIANTELHVLDRDGNLVPDGIAGELHIGGVGLARGYLGRPALTAERFVAHPLAPGARLYRTGDLVRRGTDGALRFLGRLDDQVKLRGHRIELGEVDVALGRHPALRAAAVALRTSGGGQPQLVGYPVPRGERPPSDEELRTFLRRTLPEHMVPTAFVPLPALPLTPSGKLDRKALPAAVSGPTPAAGYVPPRTPVEESVATVWAEELGLPRVGIFEDFFELGGHSLMAARVLGRLGRLLDIELPLATAFRARTVAALAELVSAPAAGDDLLVPVQPVGGRPPLFALHPAGGEVLVYRELAAALGSDQPVIGVQSRAVRTGLDEHPSVEAMAADYARAVRRHQPAGPYLLLGWSMGGVVAVSVAKALEEQGERVAFLGLVDSHLPADDPPDPLLAPAVALADALADAWPRLRADDLDELRGRLRDRPLDERLRAVVEWARRRGLLAGELPMEALRRRAGLAATHEQLLAGHRPPTVDTALQLWWAEQPIGRRPRRAGRWHRHSGGGAREETVAGNHFTMLRAPHCAGLAGRIHCVLATAL